MADQNRCDFKTVEADCLIALTVNSVQDHHNLFIPKFEPNIVRVVPLSIHIGAKTGQQVTA
jgi:hypothetical protein